MLAGLGVGCIWMNMPRRCTARNEQGSKMSRASWLGDRAVRRQQTADWECHRARRLGGRKAWRGRLPVLRSCRRMRLQ